MNPLRWFLLFLLIFNYISYKECVALSVAASIKPLHSLVSMVTDGILTPELIIKGNIPSHNIKLSAKSIKKLKNTDVVFIISQELEQPIYKALYNNKNVYQTIEFKNLNLLNFNSNKVIFKDNKPIKHHHNNLDFHIWLDPLNAKAILFGIASILANYDSKNASKYQDNAIKYSKKLDVLNSKLLKELSPYSKVPFILYHNGFAYLENRYNLQSKGIIQNSCQITNHFLANNLSNKKILELNNFIKNNNISCIFLEPEFNNKVLLKYLNEHQLKYAIIDPIGYNIRVGKDLYFKLLNNNSKALTLCLHKNK